MSLVTVEHLLNGMIEVGFERVKLTWHGGEPLLRGLQFYRDVVRLQDQLKKKYPYLRLENGMQSNLTLLTTEWCEFFKENNFTIGSSLDGWKEIHNIHRKYPDGSGTFDDALRGIQLAMQYSILGGFIAVVHDITVHKDPREFFEYLISVCPRAEITPCWEIGMTKKAAACSVKPLGFLEFIKAMFDAWWERDDPRLGVRMFHGFMQALLGGKEFTCAFKGNCRDFLSVEADGSVYPCGKFSGIPEFLLGNVNQHPLADILTSPRYKEWLSLRTSLPTKCNLCKWSAICNNGCTYERYSGEGRFTEVSPFCEVWSGIYDHINSRVLVLREALERDISLT